MARASRGLAFVMPGLLGFGAPALGAAVGLAVMLSAEHPAPAAATPPKTTLAIKPTAPALPKWHECFWAIDHDNLAHHEWWDDDGVSASQCWEPS